SQGNGITRSDPTSVTSKSCTTIPDTPVLTQSEISQRCGGTRTNITLDWQPVKNALSYVLSRSEDSGVTYNAKFSTGNDIFTDGSVIGNTEYFYKLEAVGSGGPSAPSDPPVSIKALLCTGKPRPPDLHQPTIVYPIHVFLSWDDLSINERGFRVYRSEVLSSLPSLLAKNRLTMFLANTFFGIPASSQLAENIKELEENTTFYLDNQTIEDTRYQYEIAAYNEEGENRSNPKFITTPIPAPSPFTLRVTCDIANAEVKLDWFPGAGTTLKGGEVKYNAYWADTQNDPFVPLPSPCSEIFSETSCTTPLPQRDNLVFKVTATNIGGSMDAFAQSSCIPPQYKEILPN
ncbi:MAG: cell wall-binding protein, partial [Parcubacteria group bacterium Gr01-1014_66]